MCFGGSAKPPTPTPPPAPAPTPTPSDANPIQTAQQRANQVAAMKFGMMSTIKTGPQGAVGAGADLSIPAATAKTKLGQ